MQSINHQKYPETVIVRHRRENLRKCSLKGLENREDFLFFTYPGQSIPVFNNYVVLAVNAPELSRQEKECRLLILDSTWRYAEKMEKQVLRELNFIRRSIPSEWRTAYPRRQNDCPNPELGLASVEAIWAAYSILERNVDGLLGGYYWKDSFLAQNRHLWSL